MLQRRYPGHVSILLLLGLLGFCGCKTVKSVTETSKAIDRNRTAIEQSTDVIHRNAQTVSDSTGMIESNKLVIEGSTQAIEKNQLVVEQSTAAIQKNAQAIDDINAAVDKLKSNKAAFAWIVALVAVLLLAPSLVAFFVWWQTRKLMRLWLQREGEKPSGSKKIRMPD